LKREAAAKTLLSSRKTIGIRTDLRMAGECEGACTNAMIEQDCEHVVKSSAELPEL
jgi:hypothetical protein